ncbi:MAG TPA: hypothetical protein VE913_14480 [Longimicrobium sp.]|nr:hypothetical protein [Longimicrobium sp.]
MSTNYRISIKMEQATATTLADNGFSLYAFKAVQGAGKGAPVVWFSSQDIGLATTIDWSESYQAYTSRTEAIAAGATITADNAYPSGLGGILTIDESIGTGAVTDGGDPRGIAINNTTDTQFVCGISQLRNGVYAPIAAFPLFGNNEDLLVPVEKVFLMFASRTVDTGTVIEKSFGSGMMIDLTGATPDATGVVGRQVAYDLNKGWDDSNAPWGVAYAPNTNLVPLLINGAPAPQPVGV